MKVFSNFVRKKNSTTFTLAEFVHCPKGRTLLNDGGELLLDGKKNINKQLNLRYQ